MAAMFAATKSAKIETSSKASTEVKAKTEGTQTYDLGPAPVDEHCELQSAAVSPTEVMVCTDTQGCFVADADAVDVDKVSLDYVDGLGHVLVPDAHTGDIDSCATPHYDYITTPEVHHDDHYHDDHLHDDHQHDDSANFSIHDFLKATCDAES